MVLLFEQISIVTALALPFIANGIGRSIKKKRETRNQNHAQGTVHTPISVKARPLQKVEGKNTVRRSDYMSYPKCMICRVKNMENEQNVFKAKNGYKCCNGHFFTGLE